MILGRKIKVLIVDDSAVLRKVLSLGLGSDPEIEVIGTAADPKMAMQYLARSRPDVLTLDLEMPKMDGLTFLRSYMQTNPIPTVVISSQTQRSAQSTVDALAAGAVDVIAKPKMELGGGLSDLMTSIVHRVKVAAGASVGRLAARVPQVALAQSQTPLASQVGTPDWLFAIGASTGGVQALTKVLELLPADAPPTVIVQHMPEGFTASFAKRLDQICGLNVREARHGDVLETGTVLIAPGGQRHMKLIRQSGRYMVELVEGPAVCFSCPSVNVLFNSVAQVAKGRVSSAILTGMGKDGAEGQLAIRKSGGRTVAQDEASCVVFGMPWAADQIGAPEALVPIEDVPSWLMNSWPNSPVSDTLLSYRV